MMKTVGGGWKIFNCLPLKYLVALKATMGKSKVTEVTVYSREDAVYSSICRGLFTDITVYFPQDGKHIFEQSYRGEKNQNAQK